ncbi:MAG: hypothetical protein BHW65_07235 [Verrucomicrobia bacterium CAG:312_58_20]|nr:MAG: hypothetical protein BHW65_07235 [Verrucomicrobia bacterium CAG:312_58_20]
MGENAHGSRNVMGVERRPVLLFFDSGRARELFAKICVKPPCTVNALRKSGKLEACVRRPAD